MAETEFKVRIPVNGVILKQNIGKHVALTGKVLSSDPSGTTFEVSTVDKHIVTVTMRSPISSPLEGLVEVHGIVNSKSSMICDYYMPFPKELEDTFDEDILNQTISIINSVSNAWTVQVDS